MQKYKHPVFDFDGTIADLHVDWASLRNDAYRVFNDVYGFSSRHLLCMYETVLRGKGRHKEELIALIRSYEQPQGKVIYRPIDPMVAYVRELPFFYVISNNLRSTVQDVLEDLNLTHQCKVIIGFGDAAGIKPSGAPFDSLVELTNDADRNGYLYVGDRATDKLFAEEVGIAFAYPQEIL